MTGQPPIAPIAPAETVFAEASAWETSRLQQSEKSERRAWVVAWVASGMVVLLGVALMLITPLKQTLPYVIWVNSQNGVPDVITALTEQRDSYGDMTDKYYLSKYVLAREGYEWQSLQDRYDTTILLSSLPVAADYAQLFKGPDALDKKWTNTMRATVEIVSRIPNPRGATVRFRKTIKRVEDSSPGQTTAWVATLTYEYRYPERLTESQRMKNLLGFQVTS